ncbi:MAG: HDOD domain-containing protein [Gammaproteobacteria bacterium]|nr:HDOD domain-containing protein [Gammaproteobacteria bacterium]
MQAEKIQQTDISLQELIAAELSSSDFQLPVFNEVALKLQNALGDEDITIDDIEALIMEDPALAGQILRMANSAFYKGLGEIDTIKRAILRLGSEQVASMAMLASQKQAYSSDNRQIAAYMETLWKHSFVSAVGCKWVAQHGGFASDASVAFLSGLLHDVGKLVILKVVEQIQQQNGPSGGISDEAILEIIESPLHTECGYQLMKAWNLPEPFDLVVRDHHDKDSEQHQILLAIVRLMNQVSESMGFSVRNDKDVMPAASEEAQLLGLSEIELAELEIFIEDTLQVDSEL